MRKLIMYVSAFLPMFLIMWIKEVLIGIRNIVQKPWKYKWESIYLNPYLIVEIALIILIGFVVLWLLKRNKKTGVYKAVLRTVKNRSAEYYLSYYSLFILALIEFSLTDIIDLAILFLLIVILGIVYIKNDLFFMNPTINIFQSYIYEIEYEKNGEPTTQLIVSSEKLFAGNIVDIEISEFEFTFLREKYEKGN